MHSRPPLGIKDWINDQNPIPLRPKPIRNLGYCRLHNPRIRVRAHELTLPIAI